MFSNLSSSQPESTSEGHTFDEVMSDLRDICFLGAPNIVSLHQILPFYENSCNGGTGYIGNHTIVDLLEQGMEVVCVDNGINSDQNVLKSIEEITGKKWVLSK